MFLVLVIAFAGCAVALNQRVYADGIIPALMSLYRWKPFFWETSRYGMLIPLISIPIAHPFWNLLFQYFLHAALLVVAPFLIARFVYGPKFAPAVGAVASAVLVGLYSGTDIFVAFASPGQPYGVALSFCYGGLCLLELASFRKSWKFAAGVFLILSAMWLCPTVALNAAPVAFFKALRDTTVDRTGRTWRRFQRAARTALPLIAAVVVSFVLSTVLTLSMGPVEGKRLTSLLGFREWVDDDAFLALTRGLTGWFIDRVPYAGTVLTGLYVSAALVVIAVRSRLSRRLVLSGGAILLSGVLSEMLVLSWMRYVAEHKFDGHYLFSCLLFLLIIPSAAIVIPPLAARAARLEPVLLAALAIVALVANGWPSPHKFRATLDTTCGKYTEQVVARNVTHFAGSYWNVWPAVFHANLRLYELGSNQKVWGITGRSVETRDLWDTFYDRPNLIAVVAGDDIVPYLTDLQIYIQSVQARDGLVLYETVARRNLQFAKEPPWPQAADVSHVSPGPACVLDAINNKGDSVVSIDRRNRLELLGWAVDTAAGKVPELVAVEMTSGENGRYFVHAQRASRLDVAAFFRNFAMAGAGFAVRIPRVDVPPGEYSVRILQMSGAQAWSCDTRKRINVY